MTAVEPRVDDTRERLIDGAIDLLSTQPYPAVGVKALCERAGVRKGSFYHFFSSKEELSLAALDRAWDDYRVRVIEPAAGADPAQTDEAMWKACVESMAGQGSAGCIFTRLAASVTASELRLRERLGEIFDEWAAMLGGGDLGWDRLARLQGRIVLAAVSGPVVVRA